MLTQIHIRDLATIAELHLSLTAGCIMVTGETGAGKSVFLEAIELALGQRASQNLVRIGKEKLEISLVFDVTHFPKVIACLLERELYQDSKECIIRRVISNDGRSRCYVNETPATLNFVRELAALLFHFHGQFEQQVLLSADSQRDMLDRFAETLPLAAEVKKIAEEYRSLEAEIVLLTADAEKRNDAVQFLNFQCEELRALNLVEGEWESLEVEHHKLTHSEEMLQNIQLAIAKLEDEGQQTILSALKELAKIIEMLLKVESKAQGWLQMVDSTIIQLDELYSELKDVLNHSEADSDKIKQIEERMSAVFTLSRKHKVLPGELFQFQERLEKELHDLTHSDETLLAKHQALAAMNRQYLRKANELSLQREKAATIFASHITNTIRSLSLPHGEFQVHFDPEPEGRMSNYGREKVIFVIKTNPDQALTAIGKIISGGELSRLSLAVHLALACKTNIPTLVFDEIDTGLSGATAVKIGKLLRELGDTYQVFCVTHQAQVAAYGHQHLLVEKSFEGKNTHTHLRLLNQKLKTREIARMMGGENLTEKTLAHAKEVLESV